MLRLWQTAVGNPKKASVTEFRDAWCCGAVGILATLLAGVGQYQVPLKEQNSETIAEFDLIEGRDAFIEPTGIGVLVEFIDELMKILADETSRAGLKLGHWAKWSDKELKQLRTVLSKLAEQPVRKEEVRRLIARVERELMLLEEPPILSQPLTDLPPEIDTTDWLPFKRQELLNVLTIGEGSFSRFKDENPRDIQPDPAFRRDDGTIKNGRFLLCPDCEKLKKNWAEILKRN